MCFPAISESHLWSNATKCSAGIRGFLQRFVRSERPTSLARNPVPLHRGDLKAREETEKIIFVRRDLSRLQKSAVWSSGAGRRVTLGRKRSLLLLYQSKTTEVKTNWKSSTCTLALRAPGPAPRVWNRRSAQSFSLAWRRLRYIPFALTTFILCATLTAANAATAVLTADKWARSLHQSSNQGGNGRCHGNPLPTGRRGREEVGRARLKTQNTPRKKKTWKICTSSSASRGFSQNPFHWVRCKENNLKF